MSRFTASVTPDYFAGVYAADPDPWRFTTSAYERAKYASTLESLPRERYASALEVGCSIGVFTRALAPRCDALTALDVVPAALDAARAACAGQPWVRFELGAVPDAWPEGAFDLILLSEVLYFLDRADLRRLAARVGGALRPGGDCVLVHWLGETPFPLTGDEAAEGFIADAAGFARPLGGARTQDYRLDILRATATDDGRDEDAAP